MTAPLDLDLGIDAIVAAVQLGADIEVRNVADGIYEVTCVEVLGENLHIHVGLEGLYRIATANGRSTYSLLAESHIG